MANCSAGEISYLPRIADFFHSFTHLNFYFDNVSSIFAPTLPDYQQVGEYFRRFQLCMGSLYERAYLHSLQRWCPQNWYIQWGDQGQDQ